MLLVLMIWSCNNKQNGVLLPVVETSYETTDLDTVHGVPVISDIVGATNIYSEESILFVECPDATHQLKLYSINNNLEPIANLCTKGRAKNEFFDPRAACKQFIKEDEHTKLLMYDNYSIIKTIDITESIKQGNTIVDKVEAAPVNLRLGRSIYLSTGEWFNHYELHYDDPIDGEFYVPRFTIGFNKDNSLDNEIPTFGKVMFISEKNRGLYNFVYSGSMRLSPDNSKVVFTFFHMPYMFIFDLKERTGKAFHTESVLSFDKPYPDITNSSEIAYGYGDIDVTDKYIICLCPEGTQGDYTDPLKRPVVRFFNWDGEYLFGFYVDKRTYYITFDENSGLLFGLETRGGEERIYEYDIQKYLK